MVSSTLSHASPAAPAPVARPRTVSRLETGVLALRAGALWSAFVRQSPAFWCTCINVFFEYVRPQTIYPALDVLPWAQISLGAAVVFTILEGRIRFTASFLWFAIALFTAAIVLSGVFAQYPKASWAAKDLWINWLLLMLIVGAGLRTRLELVLFLASYVLWNVKMSQHGVQAWVGSGFSFVAWGVSGAPGWFQNSGEFGIQMCTFMPLVGYMAFGLWPRLSRRTRWGALAIVASGVISVIASSSRGAVLGGAAVGLWMVLRSPQRGKALLIISVLSAFVWIALPEGNKQRWREAGEDKDSQRRLTYWRDGIEIATEHPLFGIGYKNWLPYYRAHYDPKGEVPHNFMVEAASELGFVGFGALLLVLGAYFRENARTRRLTGPTGQQDRLLWSLAYGLDGAMIGFMASGSFVTVLFYPFIWMNVAMALALARVAQARHAAGATPAR